MRMALVAAVLTFGVCSTARAETEPSEEVLAAAQEAGVPALELLGAVNTTHLTPKEYLYAVGELARPRPALSGRLACIARLESHNNPNATNPRSQAAGLFQFLWSTWATTPQGKAGLSPYDPEAATDAAEWMVRAGRINEWVPVQQGAC